MRRVLDVVAKLYNECTHIDIRNRQVTTFHDPNGGIMGLKILKALGYNEIAFVGCDARYADNDESNKHITKMGNEYISHENYDVNHFRDDYFGKGMRFGKPNQDWIIALWYLASKQINLPLVVIINGFISIRVASFFKSIS